MSGKLGYGLLLLFLLADLSYSFLQHYNQPLDGDLPSCVVPRDDIRPVLESPLGFRVLTGEATYLNPNRFFSHWAIYKYFNWAPEALQRFVRPIDSAYLACAIAKTAVQASLIFLLAAFITGGFRFFSGEFLVAAALVMPFFQTNGYRGQMAIIDPATTYVFFYALPAAFLLLYFFPVFRRYYHRKAPVAPNSIRFLWVPLAFVVGLSGPLNPGVALVIALLTSVWIVKEKYSPAHPRSLTGKSLWWRPLMFYCLPILLISLYSLLLGRYNTMDGLEQPSLLQRYALLPKGIFHQMTLKPGLLILLLMLALNLGMIRRFSDRTRGGKILRMGRWIGLFALTYLLLLPLGGYRDYRPLIVRYDTMLPITLGLVFLFGLSTLFLLGNISNRQKSWYFPILIIALSTLTLADEPKFDRNDCERTALEQIAASPRDTILLEGNCTVLSWKKNQDPKAFEINARLLRIWNITDRPKQYHH